MPFSHQHRVALAARARAERKLRTARARGQRLRWGHKPLFFGSAPILCAEGEISIGDGCALFGQAIRPQLTAAPGGQVEIGNRVVINYGLDLYAARSVRIGDDALIGTLVTIYDTDFHAIEEGGETRVAPVEIGANVWIGRLAIVLPGVKIGDHSVVAAGSIVTRDVPARTVVAGNPARVVREIRASDDWRRNAQPGDPPYSESPLSPVRAEAPEPVA